LIGRNGSGKTTLIKILTDAVERKTGQVLYGNLNFWENEEEIEKNIGGL
jgi:ABC-type multidrug transport system ATPase subunit